MSTVYRSGERSSIWSQTLSETNMMKAYFFEIETAKAPEFNDVFLAKIQLKGK